MLEISTRLCFCINGKLVENVDVVKYYSTANDSDGSKYFDPASKEHSLHFILELMKYLDLI